MANVDKKIIVKGGPKQYKRGPNATGTQAMQKRLWGLAFAAGRLARNQKYTKEERVAAGLLADGLVGLADKFEQILPDLDTTIRL